MVDPYLNRLSRVQFGAPPADPCIENEIRFRRVTEKRRKEAEQLAIRELIPFLELLALCDAEPGVKFVIPVEIYNSIYSKREFNKSVPAIVQDAEGVMQLASFVLSIGEPSDGEELDSERLYAAFPEGRTAFSGELESYTLMRVMTKPEDRIYPLVDKTKFSEGNYWL